MLNPRLILGQPAKMNLNSKPAVRKGDSLVEAVDWPHEGRNLGKKDCELIAVYAGARDVPLSEPTKTLK